MSKGETVGGNQGRRGPLAKDVAERAGVSVSTVSNVQNRPERVSPTCRIRVEKAMAELGFVRNESARAVSELRQAQVRNPSIKDVAGRAGVSIGTVSNVLNRPDRVRDANRARVEQAMTELGFQRNDSARQLRAGPPESPSAPVCPASATHLLELQSEQRPDV